MRAAPFRGGLKSGQRPDKKAGRVYGGNAGLAFRMMHGTLSAGQREKRKNRQGGMKLFFVLIFGYFVSRQSNSPSRQLSEPMIV
jgi:hypothetical protein